MATHSSTLAWKIPWMEGPGGLQSMGSLRVGHDWATSLSLFIFMHWRRKWQPTPVFLPGESQGRGAWWAAIYGVAQSQTRLSSSSRSLVSSITNAETMYMWKSYNVQKQLQVDYGFKGKRQNSKYQDSNGLLYPDTKSTTLKKTNDKTNPLDVRC